VVYFGKNGDSPEAQRLARREGGNKVRQIEKKIGKKKENSGKRQDATRGDRKGRGKNTKGKS